MAKDLNKADYYDIYKSLLTQKQRDTMEMYYFSDLSLGEISEETGVSRQAAFNCIKKCEERLTELENSLGLMEKRKKAEQLFAQLNSCLINGHKNKAMEVAKEIKELF